MAEVAQDLAELNANCAQLLSKVELICELGLDTNDDQFVVCHRALNDYLAEAPNNYLRLPEVCPAVYVLVLTVIAAELGTGGELWNPIMEQSQEGLRLNGLVATTTPKFGTAYRESLGRLGLPEFSHVDGRVNLSPILIHAGIPANSSEQVWRKVSEFVSVGVVSGREIVQDLRNNGAQLQYFKVPAKRFINESGEFAVDFFERMVNCVLTHVEDPQVSHVALAARHGLPEQLTRALFGLGIDRTKASMAIPSAHIYLDIETGMGPYCLLPPIRDGQRQYTWTVCGNNHRASAHDEKVVQLEPGNSWTWETMAAGERLRIRQLTSVCNQGLWLFVASAQGPRHVPELSQTLDESIYYLLAPQGVRATVTRGEIIADAEPTSELRLGYSWSNFTVLELDLTFASGFSIFAGEGTAEPMLTVSVAKAPSRPTLEGPTAQGLVGAVGERVFTTPPRLSFKDVNVDVSRFTVGLRTPSGQRIEKRLAQIQLTNDLFDLASMATWEAGPYRIEVIGPMGTGVSESFFVLFQANLEVEDRLFKPTELVKSRLVFCERHDGPKTSIDTEFQPRRDRVLVQVGTGMRLELRIPRLAFAIGGPGSPPNFGNPAQGVLALDDLKLVKEQQLHIRTGRPTSVTLLAQDSSGHVFHQKTSVSVGSNASTTFELNDVVQSIELVGSELTKLSAVVGPTEFKLPLLTIQQRLEFRVGQHRYLVAVGSPAGCLEVDVNVPEFGPSASVHLTSRERVWDLPRVTLLEPDQNSGTLRTATFGGVPPGRYSLEISIGASLRPLRSSFRKVQLGTEDERRIYTNSIRSDLTRVAELTVMGIETKTSISPESETLIVQHVASFVVSQQRDFASDSAELTASTKFITREGNIRRFAEWVTQVDTEVVSLRELENSVLRLLPVIIDSAGVELKDSDSAPEQSPTSFVLASRLWNRSHFLGLVFTNCVLNSEVDDQFAQLGECETEPNFEILAELSFPALQQRIKETNQHAGLFSDGYLLVNFHDVWRKCWTGSGPNYDFLARIDDLSLRGRQLLDDIAATEKLVLPEPISSTKPEPLRRSRRPEAYSIGKFFHHLYRTAWLIVRPSTPLDKAFKGSQLLAESYGFAKELTDRAVGVALMNQFPRTGKK